MNLDYDVGDEAGFLVESQDPVTTPRWKGSLATRVAAATVLALAALNLGRHMLTQAEVKDAIAETSEIMKCLPCHEKECTLGNNQWTKCPEDRPYFSEGHCKCVKSEVCDDLSPRAVGCMLCQNCFDTACHIGAEYVRCEKETPFYDPTTLACQASCEDSSTPQFAALPLKPPTVVPFLCPRNTYGKCRVFKCHSDRGPTDCLSGECMCQFGHCATRGTCVKEAEYDKAEHLCQHNTFTSCKKWNCPSSLGETKCDGFFGGFGTYNCLCKEDSCYDAMKVACVKKE